MREVRRSALVPQTPAQMYDLVNDVARYPDFVPWCPAVQIHEQGPEFIVATVEIERAGVRTSVTTRNAMVPGERIDMALAGGPLRHFDGRWSFVPIRAPGVDGQPGELRGCRVELLVHFEFRHAAVGLVLNRLFESSWDSLVDAFVRRAREVHGG
jgi:ribosome-associated toxin RatA of RatAB toxin-antitoxin module